MLTGAQCAIVARRTEDWEYLHEECEGDYPTYPVSQYELDQHDASYSYDEIHESSEEHVEHCACTMGVTCDGCDEYLVEPYTDTECADKQEEYANEHDPALD